MNDSYPDVPEEFKKENIYKGTSKKPASDNGVERKIEKQTSRKADKVWLFFKFLPIFISFVFVLSGIFLYVQNYYFLKKPKFPKLENPKTVNYEWEYKNKEYTLEFEAYESVDDYYGSLSKGIIVGEEEESIDRYLDLPEEDNSISEISSSIKSMANNEGFSDNQFVEFVNSFVQYIPYDTEKAKAKQYDPRYPYEVLYDNNGICSGKSFLMISLLRENGYGNAVFLFDNEDHMTAGVSCTKEHSTANSGYCMVETTAEGLKIGITPDISNDTYQAISRSEIDNYNEQSSVGTNKKLSNPEILAEMNGKEYTGIINTIATENEIQEIWNYFKAEKPVIDIDKKELTKLGSDLDYYKSIEDYDTYNSIVSKYNSLLNKINKEIDQYNKKVNRYNYLVQE